MMITVEDETNLLTLTHDKRHVGKMGTRFPSLERALKSLSEDGQGLWRGLYAQEVAAIQDILSFGPHTRWTTPHYKSFSEHRKVAERFGVGTKTLLHVKACRGFPLCKWAISYHEQMRKLHPEEYLSSDGDFLIEHYKKESEWILGIGTPLRLTGSYEENGWTIIEASR